NEEGVALHTLASLPHISVAGAVATATHGSGVTCGNLATAVAGLSIVTSSGEIIKASRGDPDFDGLVVGLGALGAVTRITLDVQPTYEVKQRVFEGLSWKALYDHFDEITSCGYSVSIFTRWGETNEQVWVKSRTDEPDRVEVTSSVRLQQRLIGTRSSNWIRPLVRRSWAGPVSGPTAYHISAWATHPAAAKKSSRSTSSRADMPWGP